MRQFARLVLAFAVLCSAASAAACAGDKSEPEAAPEPVVYIVGLDEFPERTLTRLQAFFREEHGIEVGILPSITVDESAYDPVRRQLVGDRLIESVDANRGAHRDRVVIALTEYDIMTLDRPDWGFVFSLRDDATGVAVVSVARMDPRNFGERPNGGLLFDRASKMVAKNIGVMYLGLPMSEDPRSVMYNQLYSVDALDTIADDFELATASR
jgi:predicted Zn-dependent protease